MDEYYYDTARNEKPVDLCKLHDRVATPSPILLNLVTN